MLITTSGVGPEDMPRREEPGKITCYVEDIRKNIAGLNHVIDELVQKIGPILTSDTRDVGIASEDSVMSPLAKNLQEVKKDLSLQRQYLEKIIDCIDL